MAWSCRMAVYVAVAAVAFGRSAIVDAQHAGLEDVKYIQCFGGSEEAKALLARQGFVVTAQQFPQIFFAYVDHDGPPFFVTEDSVWHTYHVLLEDGVQQLEEEQIANLRQFSARLLDVAWAKSQRRGDVYWDLAAFAAVGLALQDPTALPRDFRAVAAEVTEVIDTGKDTALVLFFGLPLATERFRAVSFYTKDPGLCGYFRARQWYASCAFRLTSAAETERAIHLALFVDGDQELKELHEQLTRPYDSLLGLPDDVGVPQYVALAAEVIGSEPSAERITATLDVFCERATTLPRPKTNDQRLDPAQYAHFDAETQGFRLLPARTCPSAVLMQRTVDPLVPGREMPSGLDFFATGDLACEPARRALLASVKDKTTFEAITGARTEPLPESLHGQALGILRLLQEPLPDQAPQPLRTAAWQDKQLWTALAAWAEQRHTWAGHIKPDYSVSNGGPLPHGYVSPYPKFFRAMGQLARDTASAFDSDPEGSLPQRAGRQLLRSLEVAQRAYASSRWGEKASSEIARLRQFYGSFAQTINLDDGRPGGQSPLPDEILEGADVMDRIARHWIAGQNLDANDQEAMQYWAGLRPDCVDLLQGLAGVCDRLAAIAQKELDGQPLDGDDTYFIEDYGRTLARLHSYTAEAYMSPIDDLPVVTPVFVSPVANQTLYAGIARPEALYVILDVDGQRVLHRGAVLSYREFTRPTQEPVDDGSWLNEVRTGQPPAPPVFTNAFRSVTSTEEANASAIMRQWSTGEERKWSPTVGRSPELPPGLIWGLIGIAACVLGALLVMWWRRPSQPSGSPEDGDGR